MSIMKSSTPRESQMHVSIFQQIIQSQFGGLSATDVPYVSLHIWKRKRSNQIKKKRIRPKAKWITAYFFLLPLLLYCRLRWKYWPVTVIHHFKYIYIDCFINFHSNFCAQRSKWYTKYDWFRMGTSILLVFELKWESVACVHLIETAP